MQYGLIGEHLGHSFSKQIHGRIADYDYELCSLPPDALQHFIKHVDYRGINVTIPYKKAVIPFLDEISPEAQQIGSVNTIARRGGKLLGYNTDYYGFKRMAERAGVSFLNRKVLVLGTGGTSLTVQSVARDMGASEILVASRNGDVNYQSIYLHRDVEIIINTTPVGMFPDNVGSIIEIRRFPGLLGVLDVVFNPLRTNLVLDARKLGIKTSGGLPMLVYQAVAASEIFTGNRISNAKSEFIVNEIHRELQNIVLIGMPGSGKTSVGTVLAERLNRKLLDLDECITERTGISITEIFERYGQGDFRELEHKCVVEISKQSGTVIATGGGVILNPANMRALMQNGHIYYLERSIDELPTDGRPLSTGHHALEAMYTQRHPIYMEYSDVRIDCNNSVKDAAETIEQYERNVLFETSGH